MSEVVPLKRKPRFRVVAADEDQTERVFGSPDFIARDRNPSLPQPRRFEPTTKSPGDIVL